jgi:hypothetical protein
MPSVPHRAARGAALLIASGLGGGLVKVWQAESFLAPPEGIEGSLSKADPLDWYASPSP